MSHALALPTERVDPKRVAGTAATIAVHVVALLLLLTPPALQAPKEIEAPPVVPNWEKPKDPPKPPPPPPKPIREVRRDPVQQQVAQVVEPVELPPVTFTDTSPNAYVAPTEIVVPPAVDIGGPPSGPMDLEVVTGPSPIYPSRAIAMGISGRVVLRIEVDATGKPISGTIESSSGSRLLDDAALKTVLRRWRFKPAEWNGQPIAATARVPVDFVLE